MTDDHKTDSGEELTGGYGGDPDAENDQKTAGSTQADDVGSTSPDSGLTAGGMDTGVTGSTGSVDGYSDTHLADTE
ncbi:MAG: hypothetical protein NVSMB22_14500 [Chloroflexota bacterium]